MTQTRVTGTRDASSQRNGSASGAVDATSLGSAFDITTPGVALPKGGGALRGLGEKFAANPVTGTSGAAIPILTSPGRGGSR